MRSFTNTIVQIGKTSSLAMTLCGVLKDILLVVTSMVIFLDPVTPLQAFGYSIALAGLVYYRLGAEKIKEHASQAQRAWSDYTSRRPGAKKAIVAASVIILFLLIAAALHTSGVVPEHYTKYAQDQVNEFLAGKTAVNN